MALVHAAITKKRAAMSGLPQPPCSDAGDGHDGAVFCSQRCCRRLVRKVAAPTKTSAVTTLVIRAIEFVRRPLLLLPLLSLWIMATGVAAAADGEDIDDTRAQ